MAKELFNKEGIKTLEYMSSMSGDRKATLDYYKNKWRSSNRYKMS